MGKRGGVSLNLRSMIQKSLTFLSCSVEPVARKIRPQAERYTKHRPRAQLRQRAQLVEHKFFERVVRHGYSRFYITKQIQQRADEVVFGAAISYDKNSEDDGSKACFAFPILCLKKIPQVISLVLAF
jgi:hypothetical protein